MSTPSPVIYIIYMYMYMHTDNAFSRCARPREYRSSLSPSAETWQWRPRPVRMERLLDGLLLLLHKGTQCNCFLAVFLTVKHCSFNLWGWKVSRGRAESGHSNWLPTKYMYTRGWKVNRRKIIFWSIILAYIATTHYPLEDFRLGKLSPSSLCFFPENVYIV